MKARKPAGTRILLLIACLPVLLFLGRQGLRLSASTQLAAASDPQTVEALLAQGADPNATDMKGRSRLRVAAQEGEAEVAALLIAHGAAIDRCDVMATPLIAAIRRDRSAIARLLLERGANPNAPSNGGATPLETALAHSNLKLAADLIKRGADVNQPRRRGRTLLMEFAAACNAPYVKFLIDHGADRSYRSPLGETAYSLAAKVGCPSVARLVR